MWPRFSMDGISLVFHALSIQVGINRTSTSKIKGHAMRTSGRPSSLASDGANFRAHYKFPEFPNIEKG